MTTKVAIPVDSLASLVSDKPVGTLLADKQSVPTVKQQATTSLPSSDPSGSKSTATSSNSSPSSSSISTSSSLAPSTSREQVISDSNKKAPRANLLSSSSSTTGTIGGSSGSSSGRGSSSNNTKKRKMGNEINFLNDSGVPMDGVELDSSTTTTAQTTRGALGPQLASTTNNSPSTATSSSVANGLVNSKSNNEAIASNLTLFMGNIVDESKCSFSPDYGPEAAESLYNPDENFINSQPSLQQQHLERIQQIGNQINYIRSFGDLFDDDDLD